MVIQKGLKNLSCVWLRKHTEALFIVHFPLGLIFKSFIDRQASY